MPKCYLQQKEFETLRKVARATGGAGLLYVAISDSSEQPGDKTLHVDSATFPKVEAFVYADGATAFSPATGAELALSVDASRMDTVTREIEKTAGKRKWPQEQRVRVELDAGPPGGICFTLETTQEIGNWPAWADPGEVAWEGFLKPTDRKTMSAQIPWETIDRLWRTIPTNDRRECICCAVLEPSSAGVVRIAATDGKILYADHVSRATVVRDAKAHSIPKSALSTLKKLKGIWSKPNRPAPQVEAFEGNHGRAFVKSGRRGVTVSWKGVNERYPDIARFIPAKVSIADMKPNLWIVRNCNRALGENTHNIDEPLPRSKVTVQILTDLGPINFSADRLLKVMEFFAYEEDIRILVREGMAIPPTVNDPPQPVFFGPTASSEYIGLMPFVMQ